MCLPHHCLKRFLPQTKKGEEAVSNIFVVEVDTVEMAVMLVVAACDH